MSNILIENQFTSIAKDDESTIVWLFENHLHTPIVTLVLKGADPSAVDMNAFVNIVQPAPDFGVVVPTGALWGASVSHSGQNQSSIAIQLTAMSHV